MPIVISVSEPNPGVYWVNKIHIVAMIFYTRMYSCSVWVSERKKYIIKEVYSYYFKCYFLEDPHILVDAPYLLNSVFFIIFIYWPLYSWDLIKENM